MIEDQVAEPEALPDEWRTFVKKNLIAGWGSAPRVTKKLVEMGASETQAEALITEVADAKRRRARRSAVFHWVFGFAFLPATVAIMVATDRLYYYIPIFGLLTMARGLSLWTYAREFVKPAPVPAGAAGRRRRR